MHKVRKERKVIVLLKGAKQQEQRVRQQEQGDEA